MNYFYHPEQQAFLVEGLHDIPETALAVTEEQHQQLVDGRAAGSLILCENGTLTLSPPKPSLFHEWNGQKWILDKAAKAAHLEAAKTEALQRLNRAAETFVSALAGLDGIPDFEVQTWSIQAAEAHAWHDDPAAPTPTLDTIAAARGIPSDVLKQKAYDKAVKYEQMTAYVVGTRQRYLDQIHAATAADDVAAMTFDFALPKAV